MPQTESLMTCREVLECTHMGRTKLYRLMKQEPPQFPLPVRIGPRAVRWKRAEVQKWLDECPRGVDPRVAAAAVAARKANGHG